MEAARIERARIEFARAESARMERAHTGSQLNGRAIGSIFFAGFGALWLVLAAAAGQTLSIDIVVCIASVFAGLIAAAFWLLQQAKHYPRMQEDPARSRSFNRINIAQWISVSIVAFGLSRLHLDAYIPAAITAIVGVHLFPLAKLFRYPMHNLTAATLVVWASVSVLVISPEQMQSATSLGTGLILWISAAVTIALAARVAAKAEIAPAHARMSL